MNAIHEQDIALLIDFGALEDDMSLNFEATDEGVTPLMMAASIGK